MSVSVLLPVYNSSNTIQETIVSILEQTLKDFELLIIDDGSTDKTADLVHSFKDTRIRYIYKNNGGISSALNLGLQKAKYEYIARIDADDICYPDRLEKQLKLFKSNRKLILLGGAVEYINDTGDSIGRSFPIFFNSLYSCQFSTMNIFSHPSVMFRKDVVLSVGGYDEMLSGLFEDYYLWSKLINIGDCKNIPDVLIKYRISSTQTTANKPTSKYISLMRDIINKSSYTQCEIEKLKDEKMNFLPYDKCEDKYLNYSRSYFFKLYCFLVKVGISSINSGFITTYMKNVCVLFKKVINNKI